MNGNLAPLIKEIFIDPIIWAPVLFYLIFVGICIKVRKDWRHWGRGIVYPGFGLLVYLVIAVLYVNHIFLDILNTMPLRQPDRQSVAVLCFANVSGDPENDKDCSLFSYSLISNMKRICGEYGIDMLSYGEIDDVDELKENISLTKRKAVEMGMKLEANHVILGEISPVRDILVSVMVVETDQEKTLLEFQMRRRVTDISALARKASEEVLCNLREIPKSKRKVIRDRLFAHKPTIRAEELFSEGLDQFRRRNYSNSVSALKKAIDEDPGYSDPHYLLAFIYFSQEKDGLAIRELESTIQIEPSWPEPYYFLGVILKRNGRYEEAYHQYANAIKLQRRLVYKMIYKTALAGTLLKMGRSGEAEEIISEVEETQTKHRKVLYNLAARYCELGQLDKALSLLQEAIDSGLSRYDCEAALADPDFGNFEHDPIKFSQFQQMLDECK